MKISLQINDISYDLLVATVYQTLYQAFQIYDL